MMMKEMTGINGQNQRKLAEHSISRGRHSQYDLFGFAVDELAWL